MAESGARRYAALAVFFGLLAAFGWVFTAVFFLAAQ
jgi:hypothetical protein